jgi:cytochrome P450
LAGHTTAVVPGAVERRRRRAPHPPGPRGVRLARTLLDVRRDRIGFVTRARDTWGDVVGFRIGPRKLYLLARPEHFKYVLCDHASNFCKGLGLADGKPLLGEGLLTSEGELWERQRRLWQDAFGTERVAAYADTMAATADAMVERWRRDGTTTVDVLGEMVRLTLEILGATLLRGALGADCDRVSGDLAGLDRWAMRRVSAVLRVPIWVPTPGNLAARRALGRLDAWLAARMRTWSADGRGDLVDRLLAADPDRPAAERARQRRDELMTLLLAGHETTAATLAWTWHLLSRHAGVRERLHHEIDATLGGRRPALSDLPRLGFARRVLEEAQRLYPPVWMIPRRALGHDTIGGYAIAAGADVLLSVYSLHRHPALWPSPDAFEPDRFAPAERARHPAYAYLPFGTGARGCIGSRFGLMEATLVLAAVAQRCRLDAVSDAPAVPDAGLTLRPRHGLRLRLAARP